jgi:hypothetical protein
MAMKKSDFRKKTSRSMLLAATLAPAALLGSSNATAEIVFSEDPWIPGSWSTSGYVREQISMNLDNRPGTPFDDKGHLSMVRTTVRIDLDGEVGPVRIGIIGRVAREMETRWLRRLDTGFYKGLNINALSQGANDGQAESNVIKGQLEEEELREWFVEFDVGQRFVFKIGKQQVVWGETDFFQAMDILHGRDLRWRLFFEPENEEWRKPLIMFNAIAQVPEMDGSLQVVVRPGWDRERDIGSSVDFYGGRHQPNPFDGIDFFQAGILPFNYNHHTGDNDTITGAIRWVGTLGAWSNYTGYSLAFIRSHLSGSPISTSVQGFKGEGPAPMTADGAGGAGALGQAIFPILNNYAMSLNYDLSVFGVGPWTLAAEVVWTPERPFNRGFSGNVQGAANLAAQGGLAAAFSGAFGSAGHGLSPDEKHQLLIMLRTESTGVRLMDLIGTGRPSFLSFQLFDRWLTDFNPGDEVIDTAGWNAAASEHTFIFTIVLLMNYNYDLISPGIAWGTDLTHGGGFFLPWVEFIWGDFWRLRAELNLWYAPHQPTNNVHSNTAELGNGGHVFGLFEDQDQFVLRLTRQF